MRLFDRKIFFAGVTLPTLVCGLAWWGSGMGCSAEDGWERNIIFLNVDNDATAGTDRHYTHGARAGWLSSDDRLPASVQKVSRWLPAWGIEVEAQKWGVGAGQQLYTPGNLQVSQSLLDDRPYAGWLFANLSLQRRGESGFGKPVMETFRLELGVVGPPALGEEAQDLVHDKKAKGWNNQLHTEPGLIFSYDRKYLFAFRDDENFRGFDFVPRAGVNAGNVMTCFVVGPMARFGLNLPNEFASGATEPRFGGYFFMAVDGRLVLRNIFLDGNSYQHSQSVEKETLVGEGKIGLTLVLKNVELTAAQTWRSAEFIKQKDIDSFGSATMTVKF
jgi:lipid A 3-O-deacylase